MSNGERIRRVSECMACILRRPNYTKKKGQIVGLCLYLEMEKTRAGPRYWQRWHGALSSSSFREQNNRTDYLLHIAPALFTTVST